MTATTAPRAILFDKDGTLFDFQATWGVFTRDLIADLGGQDPARRDALARTLGYDLARDRFRPDSVVIAATTEEVAAAVLPFAPGQSLAAMAQELDRRAAGLPQVPVAPLAPLLDGLRARGLHLGLATNDSEAPARAHLAEAGIADRFAFVAGWDSGHGGKPGPGQLMAFAQILGLAPGACLMVGDSRNDLRAGRAAGFRAIGVLTGIADRTELEPLAEVILPSISALPAWLDRQGG
jgi:phosphoglycolate phosphatase